MHKPNIGEKRISPEEAVAVSSKSKIGLNESFSNGVNTRVFQVMACGRMLLSEYITNGLLDLFKDRYHLVTYKPNNFIELAEYYLTHEDKRGEIANRGYEEVIRYHTMYHRAEKLLSIVEKTPKKKRKNRVYYHFGNTALLLSQKWEQESKPTLTIAAKLLYNYIKINPNNHNTHILLGRLYTQLREFYKAEKSYKKAIKLKPEDSHAYISLGNLYYERELRDEAKRAYLKGLQCEGESKKDYRERIFICKTFFSHWQFI